MFYVFFMFVQSDLKPPLPPHLLRFSGVELCDLDPESRFTKARKCAKMGDNSIFNNITE